MHEFDENWPEGFNEPLSSKVKITASSQKYLKVFSITLYDTEVMYT